MDLINAPNSRDSFVIVPKGSGGLARFINGINNNNKKESKRVNLISRKVLVEG